MCTVCVPFRGGISKTKYLSAFERGMVVGARHTVLCQELQRCWGFSCSTVSRVYQEWSTTQRTFSQLNTTVGSIGVNMGRHPCGTLSTLCRVHILKNPEAFLRAKGLSIRKVFLIYFYAQHSLFLIFMFFYTEG